MHRNASYETSLVSEVPYTINDENVIITPGQEKNHFDLSDTFCEY